jgi:hypothetical protein
VETGGPSGSSIKSASDMSIKLVLSWLMLTIAVNLLIFPPKFTIGCF